MMHHILRAASGARSGDIGIPTDGLIAWYTFDNIAGSSLIDETGNYHGIIHNSPDFEPGVIGNCVSFTGNEGYICDFGMAGRTFDAMSFYLYMPDGSNPSEPQIIGNISTHAGVLVVGRPTLLLPVETALSFSVFEDGSTSSFRYYYCVGTFDPGWHHVCINWTGSAYVFVIDGFPVRSSVHDSFDGFPEGMLDLEFFSLGYRQFNSTLSDLKVDHLRIYDRSGRGLLNDEIIALSNEVQHEVF